MRCIPAIQINKANPKIYFGKLIGNYAENKLELIRLKKKWREQEEQKRVVKKITNKLRLAFKINLEQGFITTEQPKACFLLCGGITGTNILQMKQS